MFFYLAGLPRSLTSEGCNQVEITIRLAFTDVTDGTATDAMNGSSENGS